MIPRILHLIWVGDESRRPSRCIQTWVDHHPDWTVRIWSNEDLEARNWINTKHIKEMATREWNGVADMMRWEILFDEGGVLVDADSICVQPLPEWLLACEAFACWENELVRPGLIAAGYFGTVPRAPFLAALIEGIRQKPSVIDKMAWESVGPLHLTETWKRLSYGNLTILPSHFFIPKHFSGVEYTGTGPIYARQEWGTTLRRYEELASNAAGQTFLFEPQWEGAEWVEILLSYLEAFTPEDPVALMMVLDPQQPGQLPLEQAEATVLRLVQQTGRQHFPEIVLVDRPEEWVDFLRKHPQATWIPKGKGNGAGFRGKLGARFGQARRRMAVR